MQVGLVARKRALAARADRDRARRSTAPRATRSTPRCRSRSPTTRRQAIDEIVRDLASPAPMHRLLQGEVGSGKTVVALTRAAHRGAGRLPGRVHGADRSARRAARPHDAPPPRRTSPCPRRRRCSASGRCASSCSRTAPAPPSGAASPTGCATGEVDIVVGTHALIYGGVEFARLGVAVIDEQHRFGVEQRDLLRGKGRATPDVLVMTATPIPRTAAMLDLRRPRQVRAARAARGPDADRPREVVGPSPLERTAVYDRVRTEVASRPPGVRRVPARRGVGAKLEAKAATEELERLGDEELAGLRLGLLHGQMPARRQGSGDGRVPRRRGRRARRHDRDRGRRRRPERDGDGRRGRRPLRSLAAPPAARPHRTRRRANPWCFLLADPTTPEADARMEAMAESTDGFELAERDLEIRGAGEVFGERQAGLTDLKLGTAPARRADRPRGARRRRADPRRRPDLVAARAAARGGRGPARRRGRVPLQELTEVDRRWRAREGARDGKAFV